MAAMQLACQNSQPDGTRELPRCVLGAAHDGPPSLVVQAPDVFTPLPQLESAGLCVGPRLLLCSPTAP